MAVKRLLCALLGHREVLAGYVSSYRHPRREAWRCLRCGYRRRGRWA